MSVLVVGMSHKSAPVPVLERAALSADALPKLLRDLFHTSDVAGTFVISTCNRVEIYADVDRFHGSVAAVCELLSRYSGIVTHELTGHLYVHYEEGAVKHLLAVAAGLDSMVVGEGQILGQVRAALNVAPAARDPGPGTRGGRLRRPAHGQAGTHGNRDRPDRCQPGQRGDRGGRRGAGQPVAERPQRARRRGRIDELARRDDGGTRRRRAGRRREPDARHAERLAASVGGSAAELASLPAAIAAADLVISCTGASGLVVTADAVEAALALREGARAGRRARWPSSTWRCPATSTRTWRSCRASSSSGWTSWPTPAVPRPRWPGWPMTWRRSGPSSRRSSPPTGPPRTRPR